MNSPVPGYRADYLSKTVSVQLKGASSAGGVGLVSIGPDVGQYWYPTLIRVGTRSQTTPFAACTVYAGAKGARDYTTYLDDTSFGQNDTTTICSGLTLQYGEEITAVWSLGTNLDNAIMTVYAIVTNVPMSMGGFVPLPPGARFSGHAPLAAQFNLTQAIITNLVAGTPQTFGPFDVRFYPAYQMWVDAFGLGTGTAYNPIQVFVEWPTFNSLSAAIQYAQLFEFFAQATLGFAVTRRGLFVQDATHGPYMYVRITNEGPDTIPNGILNLIGAQNQYGSPYVSGFNGSNLPAQIDDGPDGTFISETHNAVAAASVTRMNGYIAPGRVLLVFTTVTQAFTFVIQFGSDVDSTDTFTVAANTTLRQEYVCPNRAMSIAATNNGAAAGNFQVRGYRQAPDAY